jgi:hypothetical protein
MLNREMNEASERAEVVDDHRHPGSYASWVCVHEQQRCAYVWGWGRRMGPSSCGRKWPGLRVGKRKLTYISVIQQGKVEWKVVEVDIALRYDYGR